MIRSDKLDTFKKLDNEVSKYDQCVQVGADEPELDDINDTNKQFQVDDDEMDDIDAQAKVEFAKKAC
jgi:hypothetical protein